MASRNFIRFAVLMLMLGTAPATPAAHLAVIVNKSNPVDGLSKTELRRMLLGETRQWPSRERVTVVQREAGSDAFRTILRVLLKMNDAEYRRWMMSAEFRGESPVLVKVLNSNDGAGKFVLNVPGAVAIVDAIPTGLFAGQLKVLRIDGKLPGEPGYNLQ